MFCKDSKEPEKAETRGVARTLFVFKIWSMIELSAVHRASTHIGLKFIKRLSLPHHDWPGPNTRIFRLSDPITYLPTAIFAPPTPHYIQSAFKTLHLFVQRLIQHIYFFFGKHSA